MNIQNSLFVLGISLSLSAIAAEKKDAKTILGLTPWTPEQYKMADPEALHKRMLEVRAALGMPDIDKGEIVKDFLSYRSAQSFQIINKTNIN